MEYTYPPSKIWKTADELWAMDAKASLAYGFMFSSERNKKWQEECPLYKTGIVTEIIDEKYMNVRISGLGTPKCRTDYMTCDTAAFAENDVVVVKFEDCDKDKPVVVGFWDDPKPCGFRFKLTRGDGTLITEDSGLMSNIFIYNSSGIRIPTTVEEYDENTEYWSVFFINKEDADPNGYWAEYGCTDGIDTQYPYKYKSADHYEEDNLIKIGTYEDTIPHWKLSYDYIPTPDPKNEAMTNRHTIACAGETDFATFSDLMWQVGLLWKYPGSTSIKKRFILESSVPFWYKHAINSVHVDSFYLCHSGNQCANPKVCVVDSGGVNHNSIVRIVSSDGDVNIEVTDIADNPYIGEKKFGGAKIITYTITDLTLSPANLACAPPWWPNPGTPYQSPLISVYCGLAGGVYFYYE